MQLALSVAQQIGNELALRWNDGTESYFGLEFLRRACPCAICGGEPDVLGNISKPDVTYSAGSFLLRSWQNIGGYALQLTWADGHSTGLYSYQYLKRLDAAQPSVAKS